MPRLFAQDTFVVARSTFIEETTPAKIHPGMLSLSSQRFTLDRPLGGYNLTYLRPEATVGALTTDEYEAPVATWWQAGSGRTLAYTGEADGRFTGPIADWPDIGDYYTSMARWVAGQNNTLPQGALVTQEVHNGIAQVRLHLDPQRTAEPFNRLPIVKTLRGRSGQSHERLQTTMRWIGPDTLGVDQPLRGNEFAVLTVELDDSVVSLPPVTLPYSPEFAPVTEDNGSAMLEQLALATGGERRDVLGAIWQDLPKQALMVELSPYLLSAAILLIVFEVFERRSGMLSTRHRERLRQRARAAEAEAEAEQQAQSKPAKPSAIKVAKQRAQQRTPVRDKKPADKPAPAPPQPTDTAPPPKPDETSQSSTGSITDALNAARDRTRRNRR